MKLFALAVAVSAQKKQDRTNVVPHQENALEFKYKGREYKVSYQMAYDWHTANQYCNDRGMQLIEFDEPGLYEKVWDKIGRSSDDPHANHSQYDKEVDGGEALWIGYQEKIKANGQVQIRPVSKGEWINDDNTEFTTDWWVDKATGDQVEPNDTLGSENCVRMRRVPDKDGSMNDAKCSRTWSGAGNENRNMGLICQTPKDKNPPKPPPKYPESPLCPSEFFGHPDDGCYVQNQPWNAQDQPQIECDMKNKACMDVSCAADGITAKFRSDLFHSNEFDNGRGFIDQLNDGTRTLMIDGVQVLKGGECGFTTQGEFVILENWKYSKCKERFPVIAPSLTTSKKCGDGDDNAIAYTISVHSPGNAAEQNDVIEFYVDTTIDATCSYCSSFVVEADGFWINQEDVEAAQAETGNLEPLFNCKLYEDENRENQINDNNIVNMGQTIYGEVESTANLPGLQYELVEFKVTDNSGKTGNPPFEFFVVQDGNGEPLVNAQFDGVTATGQNLEFSYLSFGFEDLDNQNSVSNQCTIKLSLA